MDLSQKKVLITGGTGTVGSALLKRLLEGEEGVGSVSVLSHNEQEIFERSGAYPAERFPVEYVLADIRDRERMLSVCRDVDVIVHCAAVKHVSISETNPIECAKTNIIGVQNVIDAALFNGVDKVVALSSDKAVAPISAYGASKLFLETLFIGANALSQTQFSVVRYANVFGSKGSVIPIFLKQRETGSLTITDPEMTRFSITMDEGIELIMYLVFNGQGGEIVVPITPSYRITDVAEAVAPEAEIRFIGSRPGEKLHEALIGAHEISRTIRLDGKYLVCPKYYGESAENNLTREGAEPAGLPADYNSKDNDHWLSVNEIREMLGFFN